MKAAILFGISVLLFILISVVYASKNDQVAEGNSQESFIEQLTQDAEAMDDEACDEEMELDVEEENETAVITGYSVQRIFERHVRRENGNRAVSIYRTRDLNPIYSSCESEVENCSFPFARSRSRAIIWSRSRLVGPPAPPMPPTPVYPAPRRGISVDVGVRVGR